MGLLRYNVAMSLDGYIGPHDGSTAWITTDPSIDFDTLYAQFDTFVMGRKTYEELRRMGGEKPVGHYPASKILVVSRTLVPEENPKVTIIRDDFLSEIKRQKEKDGKDIWLFGGGELLGACLDAKLVDTIEVAIIPKLLRGGVKMVSEDMAASSFLGQTLEVVSVKNLEASGILMCVYKVVHAAD